MVEAMTPEEKAREYAKGPWPATLPQSDDIEALVSAALEAGYLAGHAEGVRWCVERLRSVQGIEFQFKWNPHERGDWLESRADK